MKVHISKKLDIINNGIKPETNYEYSKIRDVSWQISQAVSSSNSIQLQKLRGRIKNLNESLKNNRADLAEKFGVKEDEIDALMLTVPKSILRKILGGLALPVKLSWMILRLVFILPVFGFIRLFYKSNVFEPKEITKSKTPILLIHGLSSNQRQYDAFRQLINGKKCGHIFALNLNKKAFINDKKNVKEYTQIVKDKIEQIRKQYEDAGYELDEIIIVGHSMGGLVGGEFATNNKTSVKVKTLIAINTPWEGSPWAKIFKKDAKPGGDLRSDSIATQKLCEKVIKKANNKKLNLYTFSSGLDQLVSMRSSSLPINPKNQTYSNWYCHFSSVFSPPVAKKIKEKWIVPNTNDIPKKVTA